MTEQKFKDERRRNDSLLVELIQNIDEKVDKLDERLDTLFNSHKNLDSKVTDHISNEAEDIKDLKDMWHGAKGVVVFMKWLAGIAATVAAIFAFFKDHFNITPK